MNEEQTARSNLLRELEFRLAFLRTTSSTPPPLVSQDQILDWWRKRPVQFTNNTMVRPAQPSPNQYFENLFPSQTAQFGQAFFEVRENSVDGFGRTTPVYPNPDFFAASLSDPSLDLHLIYFEHELQFYYHEPFEHLFRPTSQEKLQNLYRGLLVRAVKDLARETSKFNLFAEFRSDKWARVVSNRAKSILAADQSFFSASSNYQRVKGPELSERLVRNLCETGLERSEGACLTVTRLYQEFVRESEARGLGGLKRSVFRELMRELIKDRFGLSLRNDVPDEFDRHQQAWKGLRLVDSDQHEGPGRS